MSGTINRIFKPLLDLSGRVLSFFYDVWPSYAGAILLLTICVMTLLTPITIRSTKSMLAMRRLAPQTKALQAQYRHDRQKMNEEVMALYRANNASPLGGCLPLLMQSPIFIALFQLLRGLTRRTSSLGWSSSQAAAACAAEVSPDCAPQLVTAPKQTFNPDYLDTGSRLYQDLVVSTEMRSLGLDLAESASSALSSGFVSGLPYLGMILLVAALGYYQQRQISGRMSAEEQTPQARMMMRIIPVFLPIISFGLSAGLVLYYNAQSAIRIGQQAVITRKIYRPFNEEQAALKVAEEDGDEPPPPPKPPEQPEGLTARLGLTSSPDPRRHGRQRPVSGPAPKPKAPPPAARAAAAPPARPDAGKSAPGRPASSRAGSGRAAGGTRGSKAETNKRSRRDRTPPPKPTSSRVTPKGAQQRRRKRNKK